MRNVPNRLRRERKWRSVPLKEKELELVSRCHLNHQHISFLKKNSDIFSWTLVDMFDIPSNFITHKLNANKKQKPIREKKRHFTTERQASIEEEVQKLLRVGFVREEKYST